VTDEDHDELEAVPAALRASLWPVRLLAGGAVGAVCLAGAILFLRGAIAGGLEPALANMALFLLGAPLSLAAAVSVGRAAGRAQLRAVLRRLERLEARSARGLTAASGTVTTAAVQSTREPDREPEPRA
jgi:hypothetical protein